MANSTVEPSSASEIEITLNHLREIKETVDVRESPPTIERSQTESQERLTALDVVNIPSQLPTTTAVSSTTFPLWWSTRTHSRTSPAHKPTRSLFCSMGSMLVSPPTVNCSCIFPPTLSVPFVSNLADTPPN